MKSILFLISILFSVSSFAAQEIKLGTFKIPLMVESKTKGKFIDMSNKIAKKAGLKLIYKIYPPKQTVHKFALKEIDCFFPALDVMLPGPTYKSEVVYIKKDFIFTKGKQEVSLSDLKGKRVGLTLGYPYTKEITEIPGVKFDLAHSDESNVKKLLASRIDYFIVEEKSGLKAVEKHGQGQIHYNPSTSISKQNVYYACNDEEITEKLSKAIREMIADGSLKNYKAPN